MSYVDYRNINKLGINTNSKWKKRAEASKNGHKE